VATERAAKQSPCRLVQKKLFIDDKHQRLSFTVSTVANVLFEATRKESERALKMPPTCPSLFKSTNDKLYRRAFKRLALVMATEPDEKVNYTE
jgi:hypothetical protein